MVDAWELVFLLTLSPVAAYVIGAVVHVAIDQLHGRRLVDRYFRTTKAQIVEPALRDLELRIEKALMSNLSALEGRLARRLEEDASPLDNLEAELESASGRALEGFLRSESGKTWARELGDYIQAQVESAFVQRVASKAGAVARTSQSQLERLLDSTISFGNPILDGLWSAVPRESKREFVNRMARLIRRAGYVLVPTGDLSSNLEAGQEGGADLETAGGSEPEAPGANPWFAPP